MRSSLFTMREKSEQIIARAYLLKICLSMRMKELWNSLNKTVGVDKKGEVDICTYVNV